MTTQIVWFRNDLRTDDHPPLSAAVASAGRDGGGVVAVYVVDPKFFAGTRLLDLARVSEFRKRFLRESLEDLQKQLDELNVPLVILCGDTTTQIRECLHSFSPVTALHFQREDATEEKAVAKKVVREARSLGIDVRIGPSNWMVPPDDLPFDVRETPEVFTKYRKWVEKDADIPRPLDRPAPVQETVTVTMAGTPLDDIAELRAEPQTDARSAMNLRGGETAGWKRIDQYFWETDDLRRYKETRNGMLGESYSSKFSAHLAAGCLSPRRIAWEVRRYEDERTGNDSTYWMIFELFWRDYFALIMAKHGHHLFRIEGLRGERLPWKQDHSSFDHWADGQTGYPLIDANMRELSATGFMSNRGRQNVGSFLTKNLGIDWRWGAEWFESKLIDYDPASNWGNWNYVAGVGNDARGFRFFNTIKQAEDYDPDGEYVKTWCPELRGLPKRFVQQPWRMSDSEQSDFAVRLGVDYPHPVVDLFKSAEHNRHLYEQATGHRSDDSGRGRHGTKGSRGRSGRGRSRR